MFYLMNSKWSKSDIDCFKCCKSCYPDHCTDHYTGQYLTIVALHIVEFVLMAGSISLSLAFLIKLPISNAIDEAPNRLYVIYQASVTFFAALVAFQLLFRETSSNFDVFIKAIDAKQAKDKGRQSEAEDELKSLIENNTKEWIELSEKEKEFYLARCLMSALKTASHDELDVLGTNAKKTVDSCQTCSSQPCKCHKEERDLGANAPPNEENAAFCLECSSRPCKCLKEDHHLGAGAPPNEKETTDFCQTCSSQPCKCCDEEDTEHHSTNSGKGSHRLVVAEFHQ